MIIHPDPEDACIKHWRKQTYREYAYYSAGKWLYYADRVALVNNRQFRDVHPVTAQLTPTLYCNFGCPRCSYGGSKIYLMHHQSKTDLNMDWPTMRKLLDRLWEGGVRGIVFTGGGEPCLNPHWLDGMRYAMEKGCRAGLFTNGSLLTPERIDRLLAMQPAFIRISLDAGSSLIHSLIHGYDPRQPHFQRVLSNLQHLAKEKVRRQAATTIGVGVSVEPVNLNDLTSIAEVLRGIVEASPAGGIDYLVFRPVVNYRCGGFDQRVAPVLEYLRQAQPDHYEPYWNFAHRGEQFPREIFTRASQIIDGEVTRILAGTTVRVVNIRTKMVGVTASQRPFHQCRACPWYVFVGPDGAVYNCVELGLEPQVIIGNLLHKSLDEIWRSRRRQQVLDYIDEEGLQNLCPPVCLYYEMNTLFEELDGELAQGSKAVHQWLTDEVQRTTTEIETGQVTQPHLEFI
jgi:radical SAM protein with 4Fe4S-binding SPASM domain